MGNPMAASRSCTFLLLSIGIQVLLTTATATPFVSHQKLTGSEDVEPHSAAWSFNTRSEEDEDWSWNKHNLGEDDQYTRSAKVIQVISYVVIALVLLSFAAFLICLCCPICILSKMRQRRNGRQRVTHSGQSAAPLTHVTTANTLPTQSPNGPQMIAISNERPSNSPYPVQPSVTLVMLAPTAYNTTGPNAQVNYNQSLPYQHQMMANQGNPMDLPPPYPGHLPKETDQGLPASSQPPYNPYYSGPETSPGVPGLETRQAPPYSEKK